MGQNKELKLNLGCGLIVPDGWVNIKSRNYLESEIQNIGDVERRPKRGAMYLEGMKASDL